MWQSNTVFGGEERILRLGLGDVVWLVKMWRLHCSKSGMRSFLLLRNVGPICTSRVFGEKGVPQSSFN